MRDWLGASLLAAWLAPAAALGWVSVASADTGPERLAAFTRDIQAFQAEFEQTLYDEDHRRLETSTGSLYLQRPGQFRWDYREPTEQIIVGDGERVWFYDVELAQVTVQRFDDTMSNTPAMLLADNRPIDASFEVTDLGRNQGVDWAKLVPRDASATFSEIRLGFYETVLVTMELIDRFDQRTVLRFSEVSRNPTLDSAVFRFEPPDGVDVVGE